ncbi:hypothetical protein HGG70_08085 [Rhodobacteraceae bacterium R_SAG4]|nr:hypothetical protein [Rhodobacteraceae bacterium R_SAG4]
MIEKARNYAPEDNAALVNSIRVEESKGARGRLELRLVVGGQGDVMVGGRQVNLDQYAAIVHEAYENMLVYGPGDRTLEKMAQFPGKVGSGFLTRAAEEEAPSLDRALIEAVRSVIKSEGFK